MAEGGSKLCSRNANPSQVVNRAVTEGVEGEGASRVSYRKTSNTPNVTFGKSVRRLGEPHLRRALATIQGHNTVTAGAQSLLYGVAPSNRADASKTG